MQDSPNETPRPDTPQPEIPRYETLQPGTPQQSTPQPAPTRYETPQQPTSLHERPRRPLGVTILSALVGLEGLGMLLLGILAIGALTLIGHTFRAHGISSVATGFDILGWILGIVPLLLGAITLLVAIGLFLLKRWAYWTMVVVSVIFLIRQVVQFIKPHETYTLVIIGTIIPVIILLYLLISPNVRRAFALGRNQNIERMAGT